MQYIYRLGPDQYVLWSTVTDSPISYVCSRREIMAELRRRVGYGDEARAASPERLARADRNGTSSLNEDGTEPTPRTPEELVRFNRAGPREENLTLAALLERYASKEAMDAFEIRPEHITHFTRAEDWSEPDYCWGCRTWPCLVYGTEYPEDGTSA